MLRYPYPLSTNYYCSCECNCTHEVGYVDGTCGLCLMGLHGEWRVSIRNQGEVLLDELNLRGLRLLDISLDTGLSYSSLKDYVVGKNSLTKGQLIQIEQYLQSHPMLQY